MQKRGTLYKLILVLWVFFSLFLVAYLIRQSRQADNPYVAILLGISIGCLIVFWLGSVRDLMFSLAAVVCRRRMDAWQRALRCEDPKGTPRFLLLYCTYNDFDADSLLASMRQDYPSCATVILDDSTKEEYKRQVDEFARAHGAEVVRRPDRTHYKAGNLNHYLRGREDYDYFVVLDADEVIPPDFVRSVYRYFAASPRVGAVQARHAAKEGDNAFSSLLGMSVESNGKTAQAVKNFYGANALLGHGMAISRPCYEKTGGFPPVVAEDISFAVHIRDAGFETVYAPDVLCYESFPSDYVSLKKRQCKWTQGNLEYMQRYGRDILRARMRWFEKLDLMLSHYMLPLTPCLSFLLVLCNILLGFFDYAVVRHSVFIYSLMTLFLLSPLLPDVFVYGRTRQRWRLVPYFALNIVTYASMAPMMLSTVVQGLCGRRAVFHVTPKDSRSFSFREGIHYAWDSLYFAAVIALFCYVSCRTVLPASLVVVSCLLAPFAIWMANVRVRRPSAM